MRRGLALALVFVAFACGREGEIAVSTSSPTPFPSPSATASPEATDEPSPTPTETPSPTATPAQSPAPATEACRNSIDESCGEFRWDPEPEENDPLTVAVSYTPKEPKAGDTVTFTVVAKDDGGTPSQLTINYGDGSVSYNSDSCPSQEKRYGPWTPPDKDPQDNTDTITHVYERSGNFDAIFTYETGGCDHHGYEPYASKGSKRFRVGVKPDA